MNLESDILKFETVFLKKLQYVNVFIKNSNLDKKEGTDT